MCCLRVQEAKGGLPVCHTGSRSGTLKDMLKIKPWDKTCIDLLGHLHCMDGKTKARKLWTYRQKLISWPIRNKKVQKFWHKELSRQGKWLVPGYRLEISLTYLPQGCINSHVIRMTWPTDTYQPLFHGVPLWTHAYVELTNHGSWGKGCIWAHQSGLI